MKIALLALFFLLLTFTNASDYVFDTSGQPISEAYSYYVTIGEEVGRPYFTLPDAGTTSCPLSVIAAAISNESPVPLPVNFTNNLPFPFAYAFTDTALNFAFVDKCGKTSKWFAKFRIGSKAWSLMYGDDVEGNTVKGDFIVKQFPGKNHSYKIIFCPKESQEACRNLVLRDNRYLDIVDGDTKPLEIRFEKFGSGISMVV